MAWRSSYPVVCVRLSPELLERLDRATKVRFGERPLFSRRGHRTVAITEAIRQWIDSRGEAS